jgi:hypothetical protein
MTARGKTMETGIDMQKALALASAASSRINELKLDSDETHRNKNRAEMQTLGEFKAATFNLGDEEYGTFMKTWKIDGAKFISSERFEQQADYYRKEEETSRKELGPKPDSGIERGSGFASLDYEIKLKTCDIYAGSAAALEFLGGKALEYEKKYGDKAERKTETGDDPDKPE